MADENTNENTMRIFWVNPVKNSFKIVAMILLVSIGIAWIVNGFKWHSHWDQIQTRQKLIIAVRESEGIFWANGQVFTGFERDLISVLETALNIPIQIFAVRDLDDLYRSLEVGAVDMAITGTSYNENEWTKSHPYASSRLGLVSLKRGVPENQERIGVLDRNAHGTIAKRITENSESKAIVYEHGRISAELFTLIEMGDLEYALVDERDFILQQAIFPTLKFNTVESEARPISILFNDISDTSLVDKINDSIDKLEVNGLLSQMIDRHFGHAAEFDFVDNLTFEKHMRARLPEFQEMFERHAREQGLDWRLLAAVAYQESHWRANAKSPTGVRGLMMITLNTAKELGINNRLDPNLSAQAGAQYLTILKSRIPVQITEPDKTWFALASYNVGAGHVEDARKITELVGEDPNRWIDVRKHLPKLSLKDWYPWTKYGYARGAEPVVYVANIRRFYERLKKEFPDVHTLAEPDRLDQLPEANVPVFPGL